MPPICDALASEGTDPGRAVAAWLCDHLGSSVDAAWSRTPAWVFLQGPEEARPLSEPPYAMTVAMVDAAARSGHYACVEALVDALISRDTPPLGLTGLLEALAALPLPSSSLVAPALDRLTAHAMTALEASVSRPGRAPDDWSLRRPGGCECELCHELAVFLEDPTAVTWQWPLAKQKRRHIHGVIDGARLPVLHETMRRGRPYSLLLRKQSALFDIDASAREVERDALAWLRSRVRPGT